MKKNILAVCLCFASSIIYCSWWEGGPARLLSLGNVGVVLPDRATVIDLYSAGFASGFVAREKACVISLSPGYQYERSTVGSRVLEAKNTGLIDEKGNLLVFWITPDDAICITPGYLNNYNLEKGIDYSSSLNMGALKIDYSRSFGGGLTAGLTVEYMGSYRSNVFNNVWTYDPGTMMSSTLNGEKETMHGMDLTLGVGMKFSDEITAAFSAGNSLPDSIRANGQLLLPLNQSYSMYGYDGFYGSGTSFGDPVITNYAFSSTGYNLNLGLAYSSKSNMEALLAADVVLDYNNTKKSSTNFTGMDTESHENGTVYNVDAMWRMHINDNFIVAAMAGGSGFDYNYGLKENSVTLTASAGTSYTSEAAAGLTYQYGPLKVPVEFYASFKDGYQLFDRYAGVRGGVEFTLFDMVALRLGGNLPLITETVRGYGVSYNYGVTGGIGVKFVGFQADCGISYYTNSSWREYDFGDPVVIYKSIKHYSETRAVIGLTYGM